MISHRLIDIVERSETGPYIPEADFERLVTRRVQELVCQYGLKFDRQTPIPSDESIPRWQLSRMIMPVV